ncbi:hypothetical protein D5018_05040 [Parashewanella curva]|uniref:Uncharacterized protein n=1 Tax=Parashewanella curva TaxID=2338552 RepID=A0A3L8PZM6_9GAMM|nr:PliI family lysozyme inhibitor of I-type lysozyme [Parashewanella curva]RLV60834.1 hypothetical protein D5018_05040 [Parashewanella curva]
MKSLVITLMVLALVGCQANPMKDKPLAINSSFHKVLNLTSGQHIVVDVPQYEAASIGSYSVCLYGVAEPNFPFDNFTTGLIQPRDGVVIAVDIIEQSNSQAVIQVTIQSVGSGGYRQKDRYRIYGNNLNFIKST